MVSHEPSGAWSARPFSVGLMQGAVWALQMALLIVLASCSSAPGLYPIVHSMEAPVPAPVPGPLLLEPGSSVEIKFFYTPELDSAQVVRHCSASALRSTKINVDVARSAIAAQAITVLPEPGGATRTPSS